VAARLGVTPPRSPRPAAAREGREAAASLEYAPTHRGIPAPGGEWRICRGGDGAGGKAQLDG